MFDFNEKRRIKAFLFSKVLLVLLVVLAAYFSTSVFERYQREREMAARRAEQQAELEALQLRAAALESEVGMLRSDRGVEEEIRDRYDVAKAGERVVVIVGDESETAGHKPESAPEPAPWWLRWLPFLE